MTALRPDDAAEAFCSPYGRLLARLLVPDETLPEIEAERWARKVGLQLLADTGPGESSPPWLFWVQWRGVLWRWRIVTGPGAGEGGWALTKIRAKVAARARLRELRARGGAGGAS